MPVSGCLVKHQFQSGIQADLFGKGFQRALTFHTECNSTQIVTNSPDLNPMPYEIHIERPSNEDAVRPISLDEWTSAVQKTDGVRLDGNVVSATNPHTGEVITMGGFPGAAEVNTDGTWILVFRWSGGRVSFNGLPSFSEATDPVRLVALQLAKELDATVVGDEGESYLS